jgi:hypothetical protein
MECYDEKCHQPKIKIVVVASSTLQINIIINRDFSQHAAQYGALYRFSCLITLFLFKPLGCHDFPANQKYYIFKVV